MKIEDARMLGLLAQERDSLSRVKRDVINSVKNKKYSKWNYGNVSSKVLLFAIETEIFELDVKISDYK
jgi:hypothetical protein